MNAALRLASFDGVADGAVEEERVKLPSHTAALSLASFSLIHSKANKVSFSIHQNKKRSSCGLRKKEVKEYFNSTV